MSRGELERVAVLGRVGSGELKLKDAAAMLQVSYRQAKRLWRGYRRRGPEGLKHGNAGRDSHRAKARKFRGRVLRLVQQKYSGTDAERFGPTLAAEHLAEEDGLVVDHETLRRWMLCRRAVEPATPAQAPLPTTRAERGRQSYQRMHPGRSGGAQRRSVESALPLRPKTRASLQCGFQRHHQQKGDILNELTMGTFLKSFDSSHKFSCQIWYLGAKYTAKKGETNATP